MSQIIAAGSLNTQALIVPDLYVQIVPPSVAVLNGVPTNIVGMVGTATWGPVNSPVPVGSYQEYAANFGPLQNSPFDVGTDLAIATLQGASNFRVVRVTDGTDVQASVVIQTSCLTVKSLYTGTYGNNTVVNIGPGSKANSFKVTAAIPGLLAESFDNITGTGNALWVNIANAINNGTGRGPSKLIVAISGAGTATPVTASFVLAGGTDGTASVTAATVVGNDGLTRTGVYALRQQGCSIAMLSGMTDVTQWTTLVSYGLSEQTYMMLPGAAGMTISAMAQAKSTAGIDSYTAKVIHGDWIFWNDPVNQTNRLVNPAAFFAGALGNLSPEQSSLNKPMYGITGSQKSGAGAGNSVYSIADFTALFNAGIDVICNPVPGGTYWGARLGHNSSSNGAINGDNYTRMNNFLATTFAAGMGVYVGNLINPMLFINASATLNSFLNNLLGANMIQAFKVVCNASNNPQSLSETGVVRADISVQLFGINEKFIVNLEAGVGVTVSQVTNA